MRFSLFLRELVLLVAVILLNSCGGGRVAETTDSQSAFSQPFSPLGDRGTHSVALLLPLQGPLKTVGESIKQGFLAAADASDESPQVLVVDTTKFPSINAAYQAVLNKKVQFVIGPLLKSQVRSLSEIPLKVPVLSLNYLDPDDTPPDRLYQFGLSPLDELRQAASQAWQKGYHSALVMTSEGNWGSQLANSFVEVWENLGGELVDQLALSHKTSDLTRQLRAFLHFKQPHSRRDDFDVIFLICDVNTARQVKPLLSFFYAGKIPVYAVASIYTGLPGSKRLDTDLNDIHFYSGPWALGINSPYADLYDALKATDADFFVRNRAYYALGVDAFYVIRRLPYLSESSWPGATGELHLDSERRIVRKLIGAKFTQGQVTWLN